MQCNAMQCNAMYPSTHPLSVKHLVLDLAFVKAGSAIVPQQHSQVVKASQPARTGHQLPYLARTDSKATMAASPLIEAVVMVMVVVVGLAYNTRPALCLQSSETAQDIGTTGNATAAVASASASASLSVSLSLFLCPS